MRTHRHPRMTAKRMAQVLVVCGIGLALTACGDGDSQDTQPPARSFVAPTVFQATGPSLAAVQGTIDRYRTALGATNNANNTGPLPDGRREINWDGGNVNITTTTVTGTPLTTFLNTRGARFTTAGTGFVQAPVAGLATTLTNSTYETIFQAFSPQRLFSPIANNVTETLFFVPGPDAETKPATTRGFGVVFTDVDQPNGSSPDHINGNRPASTRITYLDVNDLPIYTNSVPASPGDRSVSFLGIVYADPRIAKVRITSGDTIPGPDDDGTHDIVMMDDFLYAEPQPRS